MTSSTTRLNENAAHAAVFLDYENIVYHLKTEYADPPQTSDIVTGILRNLRRYLNNELKLDVIIFKAYADFERQSSALGSLYLMGIDTHNVLGTEHKNAADMRLSIDLMEVLYTRPDILHFVLVAGDRDYIPVVQHLRRLGRKVKAVAFRATLSGDLLQILGEDNLIEANRFVSDADKREMLIHKNQQLNAIGFKVVGQIDLPPVNDPGKKKPSTPAPNKETIKHTDTIVSSTDKTPSSISIATYQQNEVKALFNDVKVIKHANTSECLELLVAFAQEKKLREVWLSPFLRYLTDKMPLLADYERKELINNLRIYGAISVEKRTGDAYDYSVIAINYNHPNVIAAMP
ncbi:MAG: NYN domain-containing protein [Chitinophagaceae bacterium]|nr:NYN domain-containing protein [Chitinophagaceae bacterium]